MEIKQINIKLIETNNGQIDGLPKNPRFIRDERFEALRKSIQDAPEMLQLRELIVIPFGGKYVVIAGNMRLRVCKDLGYKELHCKVLSENTSVEKLKEYTIKDNVPFGQDDMDALFNEWDVDELKGYGMELDGLEMNADDETYTTKINIPKYEPKGENVAICEMFNDTKEKELKDVVRAKCGNSELRNFLLKACDRFCVFDFRNIAEYYSQADDETKKLFEMLGLVIVDYEQAISNGFVELNKDMMELQRQEYDE